MTLAEGDAWVMLCVFGKPSLSDRVEHEGGGAAVEGVGGGARAAVAVEDGVDGGHVLAADVAAHEGPRRGPVQLGEAERGVGRTVAAGGADAVAGRTHCCSASQ